MTNENNEDNGRQVADLSTIRVRHDQSNSFNFSNHTAATAPRAPAKAGADVASGQYGSVKAHTDVLGRELVTLPSGLQMTAEEAEKLGVFSSDPNATAIAPSADAAATGTDVTEDDVQTVTDQDYAPAIDAIAAAFQGADMNVEQAIGDIVAASIASEDGLALTETTRNVLVNTLGDEAQSFLDTTTAYVEQNIHSALSAAGFDADTPEDVIDALADHVDTLPASVWVQCLQGNPSALRAAISSFKKG